MHAIAYAMADAIFLTLYPSNQGLKLSAMNSPSLPHTLFNPLSIKPRIETAVRRLRHGGVLAF
ncbi:MAG: hypothetical protein PWP64_937 [Candidatus Cloacimonadota bacterium]|nr:hypothetical protein [Candidatus Cloacimonadota bacterium]